jgi:hypothetical protein
VVDLRLKPALALAPVDRHVAHEVLDVRGGEARVNRQAVMRQGVHDGRNEFAVTGLGGQQSHIGDTARLVQVDPAAFDGLYRLGPALSVKVDDPCGGRACEGGARADHGGACWSTQDAAQR